MSGDRIFEKNIEFEIGFLFQGPAHFFKGLMGPKSRCTKNFAVKIVFFRQQKIYENVNCFSVIPEQFTTGWSLWLLFFLR